MSIFTTPPSAPSWRAPRPGAPVWPALLLGLTLLGCGPSRANFVPAAELPVPSEGPYRIQVADVLEVSFFRTPELTQSRTVGPDGAISLMLVGQVRAAGRTIEDLTRIIHDLYQESFSDPEMSISVQEFSGLQVYVAGEVAAPGMIPFSGGLSLVQAVFSAGGFLPSASLDNVVIIRRGPDGQPTGSVVNVERILGNGQFQDDIQLAASDIVFAPRSTIANVNLFIQQYIRDNLPIPFSLGYDVNRR